MCLYIYSPYVLSFRPSSCCGGKLIIMFCRLWPCIVVCFKSGPAVIGRGLPHPSLDLDLDPRRRRAVLHTDATRSGADGGANDAAGPAT